MTTKELTAFRLDPNLLEGLRQVKERDGIPISEQVRRAIEDWLTRNDASPGDAHSAFDEFEDALTATSNRRGGLDKVRLPKGFGPSLAGRALGSLTAADMDVLDGFAKAVGRKTKAHRDAWNAAVKQARDRQMRRNMQLPRMSDDEVRRELFASLIERLKVERRRDPSLTVIDRVPLLMSLDRNGHLAEIDQGEGQRLMRGLIKWRPGPDEDAPFRFSVSRTADRKRLAMHPGPEGDFDTIVDNIVTTFLDNTK